jgi:hypothetical protein
MELRRLVITLIAFDAFQIYEVCRAGEQMLKHRLAFALAPVKPHLYADYLAQYKSGGSQYMTFNATCLPVIAELFVWIRQATSEPHNHVQLMLYDRHGDRVSEKSEQNTPHNDHSTSKKANLRNGIKRASTISTMTIGGYEMYFGLYLKHANRPCHECKMTDNSLLLQKDPTKNHSVYGVSKM